MRYTLLMLAVVAAILLIAVAALPASASSELAPDALQGCPAGSPCPLPPNPGWCNGAPTAHAQGFTQGSNYWVVAGDTLFSIGQRFCVSVDGLRAANGIYGWLQANTWIVIPGLGPVPPNPTPWPTPWPTQFPTPWPTPIPTVIPGTLAIVSPSPGATLTSPFVVNGTAPFGASVLVRAENNNGQLLAEQSTLAQNGYAGGLAGWNVQLMVNVPAGTPGRIVASVPGLQAAVVNVTYGSVQRFLTIDNPLPGTSLQNVFPVSGRGAGLFEGNVVVQAFNRDTGQPLTAAVPTILQGQDVGIGGSGTYAVQLTVNVPYQVNGFITASSPGTPGVTPARVDVIFGPSGPVPCTVTSIPGRPYYALPLGVLLGYFTTAQGWPVTARQMDGYGNAWYRIEPGPNGGVVWAPDYSTSAPSPGCQFQAAG
jgi:hypothetical protein